jgi:hypothetical protein
MTRISDYFLRVAVLAGLIGMLMGLAMGITQDFSVAPAHAHLNLLGWASMAIYALFYRVVPHAAEGFLPKLHFALAVPALFVMIPGVALINLGYAAGESITAVGSIAMIAGFVVFCAIVLKATRLAKA